MIRVVRVFHGLISPTSDEHYRAARFTKFSKEEKKSGNHSRANYLASLKHLILLTGVLPYFRGYIDEK